MQNHLANGFKRAHLESVALERGLLKDIAGMTPARFEFLHAMRRSLPTRERTTPPTRLSQRTIEEILGLNKATISTMAKRLAEIGWVERHADPNDKRRLLLELTEEGWIAVVAAEQAMERPTYEAPRVGPGLRRAPKSAKAGATAGVG